MVASSEHTPSRPRILVAGVGNIFLGDDAFGVKVVERLALRPLPAEVRVVDFGIRGMDLVYALLDEYDSAILVDAVPHGQPPGTLYVIEPEPAALSNPERAATERGPYDADGFEPLEMHSMDPAKVLRLARALGSGVQRVLIVGCEPRPFTADEQMFRGLSQPVEAAVDEAADLVESLVEKWLCRPPQPADDGEVAAAAAAKGEV